MKVKPKSGIEIRNVPVPKVKPGWTLIKVKACSICGSDVQIYERTPRYEVISPSMPCILRYEFSGEVIMIGKVTTEIGGETEFLWVPQKCISLVKIDNCQNKISLIKR